MTTSLKNRLQAIGRSLDALAPEMRAYNRFPMRDYASYGPSFTLQNIVFEGANLGRFLLGGNNMFNPSFLRPLYASFSPNEKSYFDMMVSGLAVNKNQLPPKISENLELLTESGLLRRENDKYAFAYRLIEFEGVLFVTDMYSTNEDMVWLSADSLNTARTIRPAIKKVLASSREKIDVLDLCCGSGLVGLWAARQSGERLGTMSGLDINPRAVELASINCAINKLGDGTGYVTGSIYDHRFEQQFDLIVSNPAYGSSPYELQRLCHRSGSTDIEQVVSAFEHAKRGLRSEGVFAFMADSPVIDGRILLVDELEKLSDGEFKITYEVLYEYDPSGTKIRAAEGSPQFRRQRSVVIGSRVKNGDAGITVSRDRLFNFVNHF